MKDDLFSRLRETQQRQEYYLLASKSKDADPLDERVVYWVMVAVVLMALALVTFVK